MIILHIIFNLEDNLNLFLVSDFKIEANLTSSEVLLILKYLGEFIATCNKMIHTLIAYLLSQITLARKV